MDLSPLRDEIDQLSEKWKGEIDAWRTAAPGDRLPRNLPHGINPGKLNLSSMRAKYMSGLAQVLEAENRLKDWERRYPSSRPFNVSDVSRFQIRNLVFRGPIDDVEFIDLLTGAPADEIIKNGSHFVLEELPSKYCVRGKLAAWLLKVIDDGLLETDETRNGHLCFDAIDALVLLEPSVPNLNSSVFDDFAEYEAETRAMIEAGKRISMDLAIRYIRGALNLACVIKIPPCLQSDIELRKFATSSRLWHLTAPSVADQIVFKDVGWEFFPVSNLNMDERAIAEIIFQQFIDNNDPPTYNDLSDRGHGRRERGRSVISEALTKLRKLGLTEKVKGGGEIPSIPIREKILHHVQRTRSVLNPD